MSEYDDFEALWGGTESAPVATFERLPEGKYEAEVVSCKMGTWDDGTKRVEWEFKVLNGAHEGATTWMNGGLDERRIGKTKGHFECMGLKGVSFSQCVAAMPSFAGRRVKISVTSYQDKLYTHLNGVLDTPAPAAPAPVVTQTLPGIPAASGNPF